MVLVDDCPARRSARTRIPAAVRRAGDSVLLLGAREARASHPAPPAPPLRLSKFHAPEIVFGPDSVQEAAHAAVRLGARRPFVVTDPGLLEAGWPSELLTHLQRDGPRSRSCGSTSPRTPRTTRSRPGSPATSRPAATSCSASAAAR